MTRFLTYIFFLHAIVLQAQSFSDLDIKSLQERIGGKNPGGILKMVLHNKVQYAKFMEPTTKAQKWYIYQYNKPLQSIAFTKLPLAVQVQDRVYYTSGTTYKGKYYYPYQNKLHAFDKTLNTDTTIDTNYTDFKNLRFLNRLIVFNDNLYFVATTDTHGTELFRYHPKTGIVLIQEVNTFSTTLSSGKIIAGGSYPSSLFVKDNYLYYNAKDKFNMKESTIGQELYRMDTKENVSLFKDFNPGNGGSTLIPFTLFDFKNILYNYTDRSFYQWGNKEQINPFIFNDIAKQLYEIKDEYRSLKHPEYIALAARTTFTKAKDTDVHLVLLKKDGTVYNFKNITEILDGIFYDHYFIFGAKKLDDSDGNIGNELYAIDLQTMRFSLLKDIRTKAYIPTKGIGAGIPQIGSEPEHFIETENEILFFVTKADRFGQYHTYSIRKKNALSTNSYTFSKKEIQVYPNPVVSGSFFTIQSKEPLKEIRIFNNTASLLKTIRAKNKKQLQITTADLAKGWYLIQIQTSNTTNIKKILVQ